nr:PREDICTED: uncharacterized protein LOC109041006 [Bemisia tabaci]
MECQDVGFRLADEIYAKTTFFTAYRPSLRIGQMLQLNGKDVIEPPTTMPIGFPLGDDLTPDSPRIMPFVEDLDPLHHEIDVFVANGCLPDDGGAVAALREYVTCNDVMLCIFADPAHTVNDLLPVVGGALDRVRRIHGEQHKWSGRLRRSFQSRKGMPPEDRTPPIQELKKFVKLMMNKLLDPCTLLAHTSTPQERTTINNTCRSFCNFISLAVDLLGTCSVRDCTSIKDGVCDRRGVCICGRTLGMTSNPICRRPVKLLFCNNRFRLKMNRVEYDRSPKKDRQPFSPVPEEAPLSLGHFSHINPMQWAVMMRGNRNRTPSRSQSPSSGKSSGGSSGPSAGSSPSVSDSPGAKDTHC